MNTKQIDYVLEVAKTKNFNRAAENLFISQPSLSYQIKVLEEEIGFEIFERSGKGAVLTLAGKQFCDSISNLREELKRTVERSQNMDKQFDDVVRICLPTRTALYYLPDAIRQFKESHPNILVDVTISNAPAEYDKFLDGEYDIFYARESQISRVSSVAQRHIYDSHIYLVVNHYDELAKLKKATFADLKGRTLMVGGGSPLELRALQQKALEDKSITPLTSENHETTLTNILAERGICLIPGMLNDYNDEFTWIPFETDTVIPCILCYNKHKVKKEAIDFIELLENLYKENNHLEV